MASTPSTSPTPSMSMRRIQPKQQRTGALPSAASSSLLSNRPRNAPAKAGPSQRSIPPADKPQPVTTSSASSSLSELQSSSRSQQQQQQQQQQTPAESECNIQVVIRCRRRSEREINDGSPIIVSSDGARSKQVTIETAAPISLLGMVQLPPTRTYGFDTVFGPEADQAMVYQDVVHPMLEEVLKGYNCTLFAYGQTGTGKTCVKKIP